MARMQFFTLVSTRTTRREYRMGRGILALGQAATGMRSRGRTDGPFARKIADHGAAGWPGALPSDRAQGRRCALTPGELTSPGRPEKAREVPRQSWGRPPRRGSPPDGRHAPSRRANPPACRGSPARNQSRGMMHRARSPTPDLFMPAFPIATLAPGYVNEL